MNINFKGGFFKTKSDWTKSSESMDTFDFVHGHCPVCLDSLDFVHGVHEQCPDCPLSPWTVSIESLDNVHWVHGHCPVWLVSLDFVHGLTGLCPECPWTLSRLSTESMVNVHWVHGESPGSPLSPWTFCRWDMLVKHNGAVRYWNNTDLPTTFVFLTPNFLWSYFYTPTASASPGHRAFRLSYVCTSVCTFIRTFVHRPG